MGAFAFREPKASERFSHAIKMALNQFWLTPYKNKFCKGTSEKRGRWGVK